MLPVRFILINTNTFKAVMKLEVKAIGSELRLEYSIHQFQGILTDSVIQSFNTNTSNMSFFKSLPVERVFSQEISLHECEQIYMYLQNAKQYIQQTGTIPQLQLGQLNIYLNTQQIFALENFLLQFGQTYEIIKLNLQVLTNRHDNNIQPESHQQIIPQHQPIMEPVEASVEIEQSEEIVDSSDDIILLNDTLKLSPTPMCTYYISKFISNIFNAGKYEKLEMKATEDGSVIISMSPLFNVQMLFTSQYQQATLNIIESFNYSNDEYISKLKSLVSELVYIINNYYGKEELKKLFIVLKIIEYLVYIYSIKFSPQTFLSKLEVGKQTEDFEKSMLEVVNYSLTYILQNYYDLNKINYNRIIIQHLPAVILDDEELTLENLKTILTRELYLIDIDKDHFVNRVFEEVTKKPDKGKNSPKLILNKPFKLDLTNFINDNSSSSAWLSYRLIKPEQKQFENNKIITEEYLHVLQLINAPSVSIGSLVKNINPIIARYADTITNVIFKELSSLDSTTTISTLNILNTYIRPYLNEDSTVTTELFILYRIILPYIYDTYGTTIFMDYFH